MDGWLSLVKGAPLEMGQCSSHSRVQIPVRPEWGLKVTPWSSPTVGPKDGCGIVCSHRRGGGGYCFFYLNHVLLFPVFRAVFLSL